MGQESRWVAPVMPRQGGLFAALLAALRVDHALRSATRRNHSATHLLHWALRQVVGETAAQKGSLVGPDRLRFDYSATRPLEASEIEQIEDLVNALHGRAVVAGRAGAVEEDRSGFVKIAAGL